MSYCREKKYLIKLSLSDEQLSFLWILSDSECSVQVSVFLLLVAITEKVNNDLSLLDPDLEVCDLFS